MDAVNDRQDDAPLLSGHQDLIPNSDAARLRLDSPTLANFSICVQCEKDLYPSD